MNYSKSKYLFILLAFIMLCVSCKELHPRKPVSIRSGSFMKESVKRNKVILAQEEIAIKELIKKDTLNTYINSSNGYWYYYNVKDSLETYSPKENDIVLMTYNIRTLENDTIYSFKEIGNLKFKIDRETYFHGLRTSVKLLKKGETATFFFPSSIAYGFYGDKNKIGTNQPLISTIKLIDIIKKSKDSLLN